MRHGAPDWGQYRPQKTVYPVHDLAELAARLGSIVSFDRRGDVVWLDDFEGTTLKWSAYAGGTGASVALSSTAAESGDQSVKLVTGDLVADYSYISRFTTPMSLGKLGIEATISLPTNAGTVQWLISRYDGTTVLQGRLIWDPSTGKVYYYSSAGANVEVSTGIDFRRSTRLFVPIKLVVDFENERYSRALIGHHSIDLSSYALYSVADVEKPNVDYRLQVSPSAASNETYYIDNFIFTQNEP